jgi:IS30 family transposase
MLKQGCKAPAIARKIGVSDQAIYDEIKRGRVEVLDSELRPGETRTIVYYCHPRYPGERGSNEKQNQMIRWFFPKGTDFTHVTNRAVKKVIDWINNYPRLLLDWHTSNDLFSVFLASVA